VQGIDFPSKSFVSNRLFRASLSFFPSTSKKASKELNLFNGCGILFISEIGFSL
jgi:hypothetical protein